MVVLVSVAVAVACSNSNSSSSNGVLPYIGYTGMCRWRRYGFETIWSGRGYGFQAIWSGIGSIGVPFNGIAHKGLKSRIIEHFQSGIGSQNL